MSFCVQVTPSIDKTSENCKNNARNAIFEKMTLKKTYKESNSPNKFSQFF